jgi:cytochrome c peroxidase
MNKMLCFLLAAVVFTSCLKEGAEVQYKYYEDADFELMSKTLNLPSKAFDYNLVTPGYISRNFFGGNNNQDEATLGRVLFYDKALSKDNKVSCASCHDQKIAFSDSKAFSDGPDGKVTTRNSLALGSVLNFSVYYGDERFGRVPFFWDNSATTVQEQAERTIGNPNEMGMKMSEVVSRINKLDYYQPLFKEAYQTTQITEDKILNAISAFVNAIPAYNTKWDKELDNHFVKRGNTTNLIEYDFGGYNEIQNKGKKIYLKACASCHGETIGAPAETRANNGIAMNYKDGGIGDKSGIEADKALFKVPTLRNIMLTAPYMHDGSIATIDDVLDHYSNGIINHPNLHSKLRSTGGAPVKMNFTNDERAALKEFFATLTDHELLKDERFSDPFKK